MRISRSVGTATALVLLLLAGGACADSVDEPGSDAAPTSSAPSVPESTTTEPTIAPTTVPPTTTAAPIVYRFPIDPPTAASYSPGHHDYPATDIFCPVGSGFVAPVGGVVDFVSLVDTWDSAVNEPSSRGGLSVAIIGDDGIRYYGSHLSAIEPGIEVGARVEVGQRLGSTGQSGNAAGTDPHLHFGISRPTTPEDWEIRRGQVDTFPLLEAWRAGQNLAPVLPAA